MCEYKIDLEDVKVLQKKGYKVSEIEDMEYLKNDQNQLIYGYDELAKWYFNDYCQASDSTFTKVDKFENLPFEFIKNKPELERELKDNNVYFYGDKEKSNNIIGYINDMELYTEIIEKYIDWEKYGKEVIGYGFGFDIVSINDGEYFVFGNE